MSDLDKLKELDRRAQAGPGPRIDVAGEVLARIRMGERADLRIVGDTGPIRVLAAASLVAVAAALAVVVIVWTTMDTHVESIDMVTQQTAEWLL
jgi:hypothetical protein